MDDARRIPDAESGVLATGGVPSGDVHAFVREGCCYPWSTGDRLGSVQRLLEQLDLPSESGVFQFRINPGAADLVLLLNDSRLRRRNLQDRP